MSKPRYQRFEGLALDTRLAETDSDPWCGVQVIDLDMGICAHWFRIGVVRPMSLSFASNEILGLITHDPLEEGGVSG